MNCLEDLEKDDLKKELGRPLFIVNKDKVNDDMTNDYSSVNENAQPMMNITVVSWNIESYASNLFTLQ